MYVERILEEMLFDYVMKRMTEEEQKEINSSWDILKHLEGNPDDDEDIQYRVYRLLKDRVNWDRLLHQIRDALPESEDEPESSSDEEDNEDKD